MLIIEKFSYYQCREDLGCFIRDLDPRIFFIPDPDPGSWILDPTSYVKKQK
jgi:hypothetical protein